MGDGNEGSFVTQQAQDDVTQQADTQPVQAPDAQTVVTQTPTAPESYAAFTMPEGVQAGDAAVQAAIDEAAPLFKELNLTQEQAQKLVDLHMKQWKGAADQVDDVVRQRETKRINDWYEQTRNHPELGGAKLDANITAAKLAIDKLGGSELHKALDETGIINHPAVFGAFVKMGGLMKEDQLVGGRPTGASAEDPAVKAALVYPNMPNVLNQKK